MRKTTGCNNLRQRAVQSNVGYSRLHAAVAVGLLCVVGCQSGSGFQRFGLLRSSTSQLPSKKDGLIATSKPATATKPVTSPEVSKLSLAAYEADVETSSNSSIKTTELETPSTELLLASRRTAVTEAVKFDFTQQPSTQQPPTTTASDESAVDAKGSAKVSEDTSASDSTKSSKAGVATTDSIADPASVAESTMNLESLEAIALSSNPSIAQQQAIVESLRGRWVQAGLRPNPSLGFSGQQLFSNGQAEQIGLYAGQRVIRTEKLTASQIVVCREMDVAMQQLATQQQRVLTDVRLRFYEVLIAQRRKQVTEELVKIAQESLNKTNSLLEAELGTKIDVLRSTVELQESKLQLETAKNQLEAAWKQLAAVVGQPGLPVETIRGNVDPQIELEAESLRRQLLAESPEIVTTVAEQQRAHAQLHRAMVEPLPDVDVQSIVQYDNATRGPNASLQVSMPIPFCNKNQGAIAEARMQLIAAQFAQQKMELGLQERLASAWQRYQSALAQVKGFSAEDGILQNSRKTLDLIRKAYDAGEIGSLELITAQRIYSQTSLQYLSALSDYWAAKIELEGQLLKGSLQNQQ